MHLLVRLKTGVDNDGLNDYLRLLIFLLVLSFFLLYHDLIIVHTDASTMSELVSKGLLGNVVHSVSCPIYEPEDKFDKCEANLNPE